MNIDRGNGKALLLTFLAGAAAGAAVALLTAPRSGRETREKLKDFGNKARETMREGPGAVGDAFTKAARAAQETFVTTLRERMPAGKGVDADAGTAHH